MKNAKLASLLTVAAGFFAGTICNTNASVVDLGAASGFSVLVTNGSLSSSDSAFLGGNIGVAAGGFTYTQTGGQQTNNQTATTAYINSASTVGNIPSNVTVNQSSNALLAQAVTDATAASASLALRSTTLNLSAVPQNITSALTITESQVGNYVLNISSINLNQAALTLSAPTGSTFVINISGNITLNGGSQGNGLLVAGGLSASNVVYNLTGGGTVSTTGGGNANVIQGTILDLGGAVELHPGEVDGEIVAKSFSSSSGALVHAPMTSVPEPASFLPMLLVVSGAGVAEGLRRFRSRKNEFVGATVEA